MKKIIFLLSSFVFLTSCSKDDDNYNPLSPQPSSNKPVSAVELAFGNNLQLDNLFNYANQNVPSYITRDITGSNAITNKGATLGRVLFYDKNLSSNNTVACASCHIQANAFGDLKDASEGVNGNTTRHSIRLGNIRFGNTTELFWDRRSQNLEVLSTEPIKNHIEMGFSGTNGDADFNALITKLNRIAYYKELFKFVYGSEDITETKIQLALAQFVKSIQSFDSKYDNGRAQVARDADPFPNFTDQENAGKNLYLNVPIFGGPLGSRSGGGIGCNTCHSAPEFSIVPIGNNGIIGTVSGIGNDFAVTRSPSLRDLTKPNGELNGNIMHSAELKSLEAVLNHYGNITINNNPTIDNRLRGPSGQGQRLNLTTAEINSVVAFLKTLSGTNIYTDSKWSNPFK